jgi:hypothetical protein
MSKLKIIRVLSGLALIHLMSTSSVLAGNLAISGGAGADFPLAHRDEQDAGISAEGAYRVDPYELRFHFGRTSVDSYSVLLGIKNFFNTGVVRPYIEGAIGPVIVNTPHKGLAYGVKPEVTLGTDIAMNEHMSAGADVRYFGQAYFGNTKNGNFEANHGFSLLGHFTIWF